MTHDDLASRLDALEAALEAAPDDFEDFDEELTTVPNMDQAQHHRFLDRRAQTDYGRLVAELRALLIPGVTASLADLTAPERAALVALIDRRPNVLMAIWDLIQEHRWRHQKAPPAERAALLRTLLRLVVLGERYADGVPTAMILSSAWGDAEDAGLDPAAFFAEAGALAGTKPLASGGSARTCLCDFEPYDYGGR